MSADDRRTASEAILFDQASNAAESFLNRAIDVIDDALGRGYATNNPHLVAAFMQAAATDMHAGTVARSVEAMASALDGLTASLDRIGDTLAQNEGE